MRQIGWLGLERGRWVLVTGDERQGERVWVDKDAAIEQLRDEGWSIAGPFAELEQGGHPMGRFHGFALSRVVH